MLVHVNVSVSVCVLVCETREGKGERVMKKGKEKVETSVERAAGQKVEAQSTKMSTLEYESGALVHSWHLKSP